MPEAIRNNKTKAAFHLRRRIGRTNENKTAGMAAPSAGARRPFAGKTLAAAAVVLMVKVAVAVPVPVNVTNGVIVQVGISVGLATVVVTAQARATVPLNPLDVTVIVPELPAVTPGKTVIAPLLLRAKLGFT